MRPSNDQPGSDSAAGGAISEEQISAICARVRQEFRQELLSMLRPVASLDEVRLMCGGISKGCVNNWVKAGKLPPPLGKGLFARNVVHQYLSATRERS